jgi:hypothetical protein
MDAETVKRCPDPACATPIPVWEVESLGTVTFYWKSCCPGCQRTITAWHPDREVGVVDPPAEGEWVCPLCGGPVLIRGLKRGPADAALRCKDGCGALIAIHRRRTAT